MKNFLVHLLILFCQFSRELLVIVSHIVSFYLVIKLFVDCLLHQLLKHLGNYKLDFQIRIIIKNTTQFRWNPSKAVFKLLAHNSNLLKPFPSNLLRRDNSLYNGRKY